MISYKRNRASISLWSTYIPGLKNLWEAILVIFLYQNVSDVTALKPTERNANTTLLICKSVHKIQVINFYRNLKGL